MTPSGALEEILAALPSILIGYSGGVDSTLLAVAAVGVLGRDRCLAVTGLSPSLSRTQADQAKRLAEMFDVPWETLATDELTDPRYVANAPDRCFHCKRELWAKLARLAAERGLAVVADGTNAEDVGGHRPGYVAGLQRGVRSPLAEAGFTKEMVRAEARRRGIPIWDAPASPCLSSRLQYGLSVTPSRLRQVETAEAALRSLGIEGDLRVRHRGREARIEVVGSQLEALRGARSEVGAALIAGGFDLVTVDLSGYRSGSLLGGVAAPVEVLASRTG